MFVSSQRSLKSVLAYWGRRLTDAITEGLNSVFQATQHKARGYRDTECLIAMLCFVAGKLRRSQG